MGTLEEGAGGDASPTHHLLDQDPRGLRAPYMKDWSEAAWRRLAREHLQYARLGGRRTLWQCMSPEAVLPLLLLELEDSDPSAQWAEDAVDPRLGDDKLRPFLDNLFGPRSEAQALARLRGLRGQERPGRASFVAYSARFDDEYRFVKHAIQAGVEKEVRRLYVSGLQPKAVRQALLLRDYDDLPSLRRAARDSIVARDSAYELLGGAEPEPRPPQPPATADGQGGQRQRQRGQGPHRGVPNHEPRTAPSPAPAVTSPAASSSTHDRETRTCHKCGEVGHIAPNCTKYPKGVPGPHKRPGLRSAGPPQGDSPATLRRLEEVTRLEERRSLDPLEPRLPLTFRGEDSTINIVAFLDTGSKEDYISVDTAERLEEAGVLSRAVDRSVQLGDASKSTRVTREYLFDVTLHSYVPHPMVFRIAAAVLPCTDELILGTKTLADTGLMTLFLGPLPFSTDVDLVGELPPDLAAADVPHPSPTVRERGDLLLQEFQDVVCDEITATPARTEKYEIHLDGPLPPKPRKLRRETSPKRAALETFIQDNLALGIIRPSTSPVCADLVFAKKTPTTYRVVVDFTKLNAVTLPVHYPLKHLKELLGKVAGHQFYAVLDLKSGFHQIPMHEEHCYLTAFWCSMGQFEFTRVAEGMRNASSFFQRIMTAILDELVGPVCEVFVDDVLVFADDEDTYVVHLRLVLGRLRDHNLICSRKKARLGLSKIEYLGHIVSEAGLELSDARKQGIADLGAPTTLTELKSFLGAVNYCRDFLHFDALEPLTQLSSMTRKGVTFRWDDLARSAFEQIKQAILDAPLLSFPTDTGHLILRTDASDKGIGGLLIQREADGNERLILCLTRGFNSTEANWIIMEKELFAIVYCIKKCSHFLEGREFTIETDNKNLLYAYSSDSPKVIRWLAVVREYDATFCHIPGVDTKWADWLSRHPPGVQPLGELNGASVPAVSLLAMRAVSAERLPLLRGVHNHLVGHVGEEAMASRLAELGHSWAGSAGDIKSFIRSCPQCQINRLPLPRATPALRTTEAHSLWDIVAVDTCKVGNGSVHTFRCCFSGWTELAPADDGTALAVAKNLLWLFGRYGCPYRLRSDNGREFVNALITEFLKLVRVERQLTLEYHPASNGIVERANGLFLGHLRALLFELEDIADWRTYLPLAMRIINSFPYSRTGITPAQAMYGARLNLNKRIFDHTTADDDPGEQLDDSATIPADEEEISAPFLQRMDAVHQTLLRVAAERLQMAVAAYKSASPSSPTTFFPGTPVLIKPLARRDKLARRMFGPRVVLEQTNNIVSVRDLLDNSVHRYYVDRLKPYDASATADLTQLAAGDTDEYVVETVLGHEFRPPSSRSARNLYLHIKWAGYEDTTWEPYHGNATVAPMNAYVASRKLLPQAARSRRRAPAAPQSLA